jgi:GntR family transcriptional regulator, vanillate catabolism transcriptional regulator
MENPTSPLARSADAQDESGSQVVKVQLRLREMILCGELRAGARLTELALVERLGVSRTPIRAALMRLEQEGLLESMGRGGHAVRTFSETDVADAIELRGTLEGLCVRRAAERGVDPGQLAQAAQVLDRIDEVLTSPALDDAAFSRYVALNQQFHELLGELSGSAVLQREATRACSLPFASPSGFVLAQATSAQARDMLIVAQDQHRQVLDAIYRREGARAESIMREHSRIAQRNLRQSMTSESLPPELRLIQAGKPSTPRR